MAVCSLAVALFLSDLKVSEEATCHGLGQSEWANYTSVGLLMLYIIFFSIGPSCIPWMITPELFTVGTVSTACSIANVLNWLANFSVQMAFTPLSTLLCGWVFLFFVFFLLIFSVYLYFFLPETKGMSVAEIVDLFR